MFLYTAIEAIVAIVAGILIATCMKRADGVTCCIGLGLSVAFRKSGNWVLPCSLQVPEVSAFPWFYFFAEVFCVPLIKKR